MALRDNKILGYFIQSKEELKKVSWPSRKETVRSTILVIAMTLAVAAFLGAVDLALNYGLEKLLSQQ